MIRVLVIADDMTGANDTGAQFSKNGFPAFTAIRKEISGKMQKEKVVACFCTDSRAEDGVSAKRKVKETAEAFWKPGMLPCKRIDSTLRGNIGMEIDGFLEALPHGWKAAVVPACPGAGRICVGGHILVHGVPLDRSGASRDEKTPVSFLKAEDIIRQQSLRRCESFELQEIHEGAERLAEKIRASKAEILIFDSAQKEDIGEIASACQRSGVRFLCVDPGDFSLEMAEQMLGNRKRKIPLLIVGSISEVARRQISYVKDRRKMKICSVSIRGLLENFEGESRKMWEELSGGRQKEAADKKWNDKTADCGIIRESEVLCLTTEPNPVEMTAKEAEAAACRLSRLGLQILECCQEQIGCTYLSGGDVAKSFLELLEPEGIELIDEVFPLAVYGKITGGKWSGLQILTKGGMIGGEDMLDRMLCYADEQRRKESGEGYDEKNSGNSVGRCSGSRTGNCS